jgi:hypothetical protein
VKFGVRRKAGFGMVALSKEVNRMALCSLKEGLKAAQNRLILLTFSTNDDNYES